MVQPMQIKDMSNDHIAGIDNIVKAANGKRFVFLGESHTNPEHHKFQAHVIEAFARSGRTVIVGFEMFQRPKQSALNPWTMGMWSEEQFLTETDWKHQWGYDFALYRPIFEVTREYKIPMVALNIPRDWVRAVGRSGFSGLTEEQRRELPTPLGTYNPVHRQIFTAMIGSAHPMTGTSADNMYSGQVLWDEAMADSALKYLDAHSFGSDPVFIVIAGSGHVMYGQGINWRIFKRTGEKGVTVVMVDGDKPVTVSRGLGDFVFCGGMEKS